MNEEEQKNIEKRATAWVMLGELVRLTHDIAHDMDDEEMQRYTHWIMKMLNMVHMAVSTGMTLTDVNGKTGSEIKIGQKNCQFN